MGRHSRQLSGKRSSLLGSAERGREPVGVSLRANEPADPIAQRGGWATTHRFRVLQEHRRNDLRYNCRERDEHDCIREVLYFLLKSNILNRSKQCTILD